MIITRGVYYCLFSKCLSSILNWIVLWFTAVPFFLILFTIRFLSSRLAPLVYKDISKIVSIRSSIFAAKKDELKSPVVLFFGLEGNVELDDLCATCESRFIQKKTVRGNIQWPELQQFILNNFGFLFWKWDKSFNIRNHFYTLKTDPKFNETGLSPQDILDILEEKVLHEQFPVTQSPWEMLFVSNFRDTPVHGDGAVNETAGRVDTMVLFHYDHILGKLLCTPFVLIPLQ